MESGRIAMGLKLLICFSIAHVLSHLSSGLASFRRLLHSLNKIQRLSLLMAIHDASPRMSLLVVMLTDERIDDVVCKRG